MGPVARYGDHLLVGEIVLRRVDDHAVAHHDAGAGKQGRDALVERVVRLDQEHRRAAALQIAAQHVGFAGAVAGPRISFDNHGAIIRDRLSGGEGDLAGDEAQLLDGASQAAETVLLHLHDTGAGDVVAVVVGAFKMRVELEIVDVVFAVTRRKADHNLASPQQSQHAERDLAIVSGDHFDAALTEA